MRGTHVGLKRIEDIGSGGPTLDRNANKPRDPNDRHSVDRAKVAQNERFPEALVRLACDEEVEIWSRNKEACLAAGGRLYAAQNCKHPDSVNRYPKDQVDVT